MSLFTGFMTDLILLERRTGINARGSATYAPAETIYGRMSYGNRETVTQDGQTRITDATLLSPVALLPGDRVTYDGNPRIVQAAYERKGVFGRTDHWEVRL